MNVILFIFHAFILFSIAYIVSKKQEATLHYFFWPAFIIKLIAGVLLGLMYQHYYSGGDTFIFFRDATQLSNLFRENAQSYFYFLWSSDSSLPVWSSISEIQPRSLFFTKIISVINILTFDNYWATSLYLSAISFLGSWYLVRRLLQLFPGAKGAVVFSILFFPTVIFWSSGVIKESLAMASFFFLAGVLLLLITKARPDFAEWLLIPICFWVAWTLKYYWAVVFIPAVMTTWLMQHVVVPRVSFQRPFQQYLVWLVLFLIICSGAMFVHPNFYPEYFLHVIVDNNETFNSISGPDNLIHFADLQPTWTSLFINAPWALFSGLLRPFIFEGGSAVKILYAIENLVVLLLLLSSVSNIKKMKGSFGMIAFAVLVYSVVLCVFLTLSTPNFGTLARYRVGFLPFLIFILCYKNPMLERLIIRFRQ